MPRLYPAPHPHNGHPLLISGVVLAALLALLLPTVASAQDYEGVYDDETTVYYDNGSDRYNDDPGPSAPYNDGSDDDAYYNSPAYYNAGPGRTPYAGKEVARDYLSGDYYRYAGQPAQDRRAREQTGYRDGVLHTRPRGYYHRRGYNYYDQGCGCSRRAYYRVYNSWGEHEYRQVYRQSARGDEFYDRRRYYESRDRYDRY